MMSYNLTDSSMVTADYPAKLLDFFLGETADQAHAWSWSWLWLLWISSLASSYTASARFARHHHTVLG